MNDLEVRALTLELYRRVIDAKGKRGCTALLVRVSDVETVLSILDPSGMLNPVQDETQGVLAMAPDAPLARVRLPIARDAAFNR